MVMAFQDFYQYNERIFSWCRCLDEGRVGKRNINFLLLIWDAHGCLSETALVGWDRQIRLVSAGSAGAVAGAHQGEN